jgi:hypothetical protein
VRAKCLGISGPLVKYCIPGGYLVAIVMSENKCVKDMVALLGIGVKGIRKVVSAFVTRITLEKILNTGVTGERRVDPVAAPRIPLWLPSGWECRGRRLSRG